MVSFLTERAGGGGWRGMEWSGDVKGVVGVRGWRSVCVCVLGAGGAAGGGVCVGGGEVGGGGGGWKGARRVFLLQINMRV